PSWRRSIHEAGAGWIWPRQRPRPSLPPERRNPHLFPVQLPLPRRRTPCAATGDTTMVLTIAVAIVLAYLFLTLVLPLLIVLIVPLFRVLAALLVVLSILIMFLAG